MIVVGNEGRGAAGTTALPSTDSPPTLRPMRSSICVFCGSSPGADPRYAAAAKTLGRLLGEQDRRLVYGGGNVGLMGILADAALEHGAEVVGVIPRHLLAREVGHAEIDDLRVVGSMHERKQVMAELAQGFIVLPGGLGTMEEFFEVWTWGQLGLHRKPYGILNVAGYFDALLAFLDQGVEQRFIRPAHRGLLIEDTEVASLLHALDEHQPLEAAHKWIDRETT